MKTISKRILVAFLIVMMTISGIAPSVMSNLLVAKASPEDTVVTPALSATPEPSTTPEPTATPTPTEEPGDEADGDEGGSEGTPVVTPEEIPEGTPNVTPVVTPSVTPEVTPSVTLGPTPTLGFSIGLFNFIPGLHTAGGIAVEGTIDLSDGNIYIITATQITVYTVTLTGSVSTMAQEGLPRPYSGGAIEVIGNNTTRSGRIWIETGANPTLVLNNVSALVPQSAIISPLFSTMGTSPIVLKSGASATVRLASGTDNSLTCNGSDGTSLYAQAGIHVPVGSSLTIESENADTSPGKLTARAGSYAAGIGGPANQACGTITITGGIITAQTNNIAVSATNPSNGAGIGGGGSNSWNNNGINGKITITGDAVVSARSGRNGAGIGSGGTEYASNTDAGEVEISGNARVTAISNGSGAGIGGGGMGQNSGSIAGLNPPAGTKRAGSGGVVTITDNAVVTAYSGGENGTGMTGAATNGGAGLSGAGIGGGGIGGANKSADNRVLAAGHGGTVTISGNATVTARGGNQGVGIGGGGATDVAATTVTATPGNGAKLTISGNPLVVISGAFKDIGAGIFNNKIDEGVPADVRIINGNVYADHTKSDLIQNNHDDALGRVDLELQKEGPQLYPAISYNNSNIPYNYSSTKNAEGTNHIWIPLGNQIVMHRQRGIPVPNDIITFTVFDIKTAPWSTVPSLETYDPEGLLPSGYVLWKEEQPKPLWVAGVSLPRILYEYIKDGEVGKDFYALKENGTTLEKYTVGDKLGYASPNLDVTSAEITGPRIITEGGVYHLKTYGLIEGSVFINTAQMVVIILDGANWKNATDLAAGASSTAGTDDAPIRLGPTANVKLVVMDDSVNSFFNGTMNGNSSSRGSGIFVPSVINKNTGQVTSKSVLTITGGTIDNDIDEYKNNGTLSAKTTLFAAAIGGGCNQNAGDINIWGGIISADTGPGNGAGIGGGGGRTAGGGKSTGITITGQANVTATSAEDGAGIGGAGGGYSADVSGVTRGPSDGGIIKIQGSDKVIVNATAKRHGAGIGGGGRSSVTVTGVTDVKGGAGGNITISGNVEVTAISEGMGAGIGGAGALAFSAGDGGTISISDDAKVIARSTDMGAAIGGGGVRFSGAKPDITEGRGGEGGTISITGNADVEAFSAGRGAGIGGGGADNGYGGSTSRLEFGGTVKINASSTISGAGIGGGGGTWGAGSADTIIIKENAYIVASAGEGITSGPSAVEGSPMGAGIGGGGSAQGVAGNATSLTISGPCYVEAISGGSSNSGGGAAIGGGGAVDNTSTPGDGGNVVIKNDGTSAGTPTVIANGNPNGMDFGYGIKPSTTDKGEEGNLTITSGNVWAVHENTPLATNGFDVVKMRRAPHDDWWDGTTHVKPPTPKLLRYEAHGQAYIASQGGPYEYSAWTHDNTDNGWAFVWKPSDYIDITMKDNEKDKIYFSHSQLESTTREAVPIEGTAIWQGSSFKNLDILEDSEADPQDAEFDKLAQAIKIEWFRVPTSDVTVYGERHTHNNVASFDEKYNELMGETGHPNADIIPVVGEPSETGEFDFEGETRKNGIIWVKITFGNKAGFVVAGEYLESGTAYYSLTVENFYTIVDIMARDVTLKLPNERALVVHYRPLENADYGEPGVGQFQYGIPYELDSTTKVVKGNASGIPKFGFDYVRYTSYSHPNLSGHKLTTPSLFVAEPEPSLDYILRLDQLVANNQEVDTQIVGEGAPDPGTSTVDTKYYYMEYLAEYVLTVNKKVTGKFANTTKEFSFTATFTQDNVPYTDDIGYKTTGPGGDGVTYVTTPGDNGVVDFTLKHGQQINFFSFSTVDEHGVPIDHPVVAKVEENDADMNGYSTTFVIKRTGYSGGGGVPPTPTPIPTTTPAAGGTAGGVPELELTANVEITFTNHRLDIVPSAVEVSDSSFFGPAIAILELMILAALLVRYRKVKQERLVRLVNSAKPRLGESSNK